MLTKVAVGQPVSVMAKGTTGSFAYHGTLTAVADDGSLSIEVLKGCNIVTVEVPAGAITGAGLIRNAKTNRR